MSAATYEPPVVKLRFVNVAAAFVVVSRKLYSTWFVVPTWTLPAPICVPLSASATYGVPSTVVTVVVAELPPVQPPAPIARTRQ